MCSLTSDPPCWIAPPRSATNDANDFLLVLTWLLEAGALVAGDFLVLDNARVHFAAEIQQDIEDLLYITGVKLMFLPAYSPELNPCELIFSLVKNKLRNYRGEGRLWAEAQQAFLSITHEQVRQEYKHCLLSVLE